MAVVGNSKLIWTGTVRGYWSMWRSLWQGGLLRRSM